MKAEDKIIILANGSFPSSQYGRMLLEEANQIICCDEAADWLLSYGKEPDLIVGDMDSISGAMKERYNERLVEINEQETNDLTKAVKYCMDKQIKEVVILAATGLREDHTLGNISLLLEYNKGIKATMVTDHGEFSVLDNGEKVSSFPGEKISFFSVDNNVTVTSEGLKYPLKNMQLYNWWRASLNETVSDSFVLHFKSEWPLILFRVRPL